MASLNTPLIGGALSVHGSRSGRQMRILAKLFNLLPTISKFIEIMVV